MRPLKSHFPDDALETLDHVVKQTKESRVFRRAQAVREMVAGQTVKSVSETLHFTNSALRKWVQRFANQGTPGLLDRLRSGRPPKMTVHSNTILIASSIKTLSITAPSILSGAVANSLRYWLNKPVSNSVVKVYAGC